MKVKRLFVGLFLFTSAVASAQQMPDVPTDQAVRIGKLDNGLTYYLRHNNTPEKKANFYIAQRVGSIQEDDSQLGLAHFLEHMAFNGTKHFAPGKMIEYLQTLGVAYGRSLNAYTGFDRTVYHINDVPTERQTALDSCMLILRDWSNDITITPEEIEKERDVIHNEYRLSTGATMRMLEHALPQLFPNSKYGVRMPIGKMEIIDHFKPEALEAYYRKWYRPDNQAIVVVGDIDVDYTENLIKKMFSDIMVAADAARVTDEPVPDNEQAIYVAEKDKEMPYSMFIISMKRDPVPAEIKKTMANLVTDYLGSLVCSMLDARLSEIAQQPDCPFLGAQTGDGKYMFDLAKTKNAFYVQGGSKDNQDAAALQTIVRELRRVKLFGFTAPEFARAKEKFLSAAEKDYNNRDKKKNEEYAKAYLENYLEQSPIPSTEDYYQIISMLAQQLPFEVVNQYAQKIINVDGKNLVALNMEQEKDGKDYLTVDAMKTAVEAAQAEELTAWVDNAKDEPLMSELPAKGQIVKETENTVLGFKELTLSNGAKVILKKTDFKTDEIMLQGEAKGGMSLFGKEDMMNMFMMDPVIEYSGRGNFSKSELDKALAGKQVSTYTKMQEDRQYIGGKSTPKDLETLFQLVYLTMTDINKDVKSVALVANQVQVVLANKGLNHEMVYNDSVESTKNCGNSLYVMPEVEKMKEFDYDRALEMAKQLYGHGGQFTYTIVGNFDEQQIRSLIEQYLASMPQGQPVQAKDIRTFFKGEKVNRFTRKMETPQAVTTIMWLSDELPYTIENKVLLDAASKILTNIYLRTVREEESAAYAVGCKGEVDNFGDKPVFILSAIAPTNPDKQQIAYDLILKHISEAAQQISQDDLDKVREVMLKQADDQAKENEHWMNVLTEWTAEGVDLQTNYVETVKALTPQKIQQFLAAFLATGNYAEIVMMPEQ